MTVNVYNHLYSNICRFLYSFILCRAFVNVTLISIKMMPFSVKALYFYSDNLPYKLWLSLKTAQHDETIGDQNNIRK